MRFFSRVDLISFGKLITVIFTFYGIPQLQQVIQNDYSKAFSVVIQYLAGVLTTEHCLIIFLFNSATKAVTSAEIS